MRETFPANSKRNLSGADEKKITKAYTTNVEAYKLYLQGRFYWNKREEKEFRKAVKYFSQAIALDRNYALAYAGLADSWVAFHIWLHAAGRRSTEGA